MGQFEVEMFSGGLIYVMLIFVAHGLALTLSVGQNSALRLLPDSSARKQACSTKNSNSMEASAANIFGCFCGKDETGRLSQRLAFLQVRLLFQTVTAMLSSYESLRPRLLQWLLPCHTAFEATCCLRTRHVPEAAPVCTSCWLLIEEVANITSSSFGRWFLRCYLLCVAL